MIKIGRIGSGIIGSSSIEHDFSGICYELLVFEDDSDHFDKILEGISNTTDAKKIYRVIRFSREISKENHIGNKYGKWKKIVSDTPPDIYYVLKDSIVDGNTKTISWWPEDFDAAILDIYDLQENEVGTVIAKWLYDANFVGPTVLISKRGIPINTYDNPYNHILKEGNWHIDVTEKINDNISVVQSVETNVGIHGKRPEDVLSELYNNPKFRNPRRWTSAWIDLVGKSSQSIVEKIVSYFSVNNSARARSTDILSSVARNEGVNLLFVDTGDVFKEEHAKQVLGALVEMSEHGVYPIPLVLTKKVSSDIPNEVYFELQKRLLTFAPRNTITQSPTVWLSQSVSKLAHSYGLWQSDSRFAEEFFRSSLPLYIASRSRARMVGNRPDYPTTGMWYSSSPVAAQSLYSSLGDELNKAIDQLLDEHLNKKTLVNTKLIPNKNR